MFIELSSTKDVKNDSIHGAKWSPEQKLVRPLNSISETTEPKLLKQHKMATRAKIKTNLLTKSLKTPESIMNIEGTLQECSLDSLLT